MDIRYQEQDTIQFNELTNKLKNDLKNFFEKKPLYSKQNIELERDFDENKYVSLSITPENAPARFTKFIECISVFCSVCEKERNFKCTDSDPIKNQRFYHDPEYPKFCFYSFQCVLCRKDLISYFIEFNLCEGWIRKVGQKPPKSISVPDDISKELGEDAELYKRALMCISQSHGIGACAYLRRLIENQINPILKLLYEIKEHTNAESEDLKKIQEAINGKDFSRKTEVASQILPDSLVVDGLNPLKLIHEDLSAGLHGLTEERCTEISQELSWAVEYVIRELNRQQKSKREFAEKMKTLAKSRKKPK